MFEPKFRKVTFKQDHRCFKSGDVIEFRGRTNLIVGLNGSGKSTLLQLIGDYTSTNVWKSHDHKKAKDIINIDMDEGCKIKHYDFEKDNKRTLNYFDWDDKDMDVGHHMHSMWMSHGESAIYAIDAIMSKEYDVYLLDEPDQAASIRVAMALSRLFLLYPFEKNIQIIASVHHPFIMQEIGTVYDLKKKEYVEANAFIEEMRQPGPMSSLDENRKQEPKTKRKKRARAKPAAKKAVKK